MKTGCLSVLIALYAAHATGAFATVAATSRPASAIPVAAGATDAFVLTPGQPLPENTWAQVSTPPSTRFLPQYFTNCTASGYRAGPVSRVRSGLAYGAGMLFYFGGGDKGHPGNDVEIYDVASSTWRQQYPPECVPACCCEGECDPANPCANDPAGDPTGVPGPCRIIGGVGSVVSTPLGRPYTEHTYHVVAYHPLRQRFTAVLTSGVWEWDPLTTDWTHLSPDRPSSADVETKHVAYDPDVGMLYFATAPPSGPPSVYVYDYTNNVWTKHGDMPAEILNVDDYGEFYTAYDPDDHVHLASHAGTQRQTTWLYQAATGVEPNAGTWTLLTNVPSELDGWSSAAYDTANHVFVVAQRRQDGTVGLWTYSVAANQWRALAPLGVAPAGESAAAWGMLAYDPPSARFYFVNAENVSNSGTGGTNPGDVQTWAYRLPESDVADANCDGRVGAADVTAAIDVQAGASIATCGAGGPPGVNVEAVIASLFAPRRSGLACANVDDRQIAFAIADGADDASVKWSGSSYPPPAGPGTGVSTSQSDVGVFRSSSGGYFVYNALLRWDTSILPAGARITQAWLRVHVDDRVDTDGLELSAGWYDWANGGGADVSDWTSAPEIDALPGVNLSALAIGSWNTMPLANVATGISTDGFTYMRLHVSQLPGDASPTAQNYAIWSAREAGAPSELVVCYAPAAAEPPQ